MPYETARKKTALSFRMYFLEIFLSLDDFSFPWSMADVSSSFSHENYEYIPYACKEPCK